MDSSHSSTKNDGKGAAEEPEPEPDGSLSSSTAASYDPTVFQRPHPDDRGGADGTPRKKGNGLLYGSCLLRSHRNVQYQRLVQNQIWVRSQHRDHSVEGRSAEVGAYVRVRVR